MAASTRIGITVIAAVLLLAPGTGARADALDGNWCFTDGRHLYIEGPKIVTPGGTKMTGNYRRHTFSYVVPDREPEAGLTVFMDQQSEELMHLTVRDRPGGPPVKPMQVWQRCKYSS